MWEEEFSSARPCRKEHPIWSLSFCMSGLYTPVLNSKIGATTQCYEDDDLYKEIGRYLQFLQNGSPRYVLWPAFHVLHRHASFSLSFRENWLQVYRSSDIISFLPQNRVLWFLCLLKHTQPMPWWDADPGRVVVFQDRQSSKFRFIASAISSLPFNFENEPLLLIFDTWQAITSSVGRYTIKQMIRYLHHYDRILFALVCYLQICKKNM